MNFALAFGRTLIWRPHRALGALFWYAMGRKVRARNRLRLATAQTRSAYAQWISSIERLRTVEEMAPSLIAKWERRPTFSILIYADAHTTHRSVIDSVKSIGRQFYGRWDLMVAAPQPMAGQIANLGAGCHLLTIANSAEAFNRAISIAKGDYVLLLRAGDKLSPAALFRYAELLQDNQPAIVYGDEDQLGRKERRIRPWFKPDWNAEMFLAQDYISASCIVKTGAAKAALPIQEASSMTAAFALTLGIVAQEGTAVHHIAHILTHRAHGNTECSATERAAIVACHVAAYGAAAYVGDYESVRVEWPLPKDLPKVSIIVPTRDKVKLLSACINGILSATSYPNFEVIIVDNGSEESATHRYLRKITQDSRVRVLRYEAPYNYSAINNYAADHAHGDYLCLLNNDTEILHRKWLNELVRQAVRPHVGAVGAKLLYPDGSIQHAGVVIGLGDAAGHAHRFLRKGRAGYFNLAHLAQYVSAVTAACLVVEKRKFEAVGGLDADNLAIAFNDVDLCLKLEAAGWRNIYTPHAVLIHHESKSRGKDISPHHIERYLRELKVLQSRWSTKTYRDPLHNPNFNRAYETFTIQSW